MPVTFAPGSIDELEKTVAWAIGEGAPLEIVGAGTKRGFGRPVEAAHVLDTTRLAGIGLYEPDELVMSAGAGTPLAVIEAELAERGQELAFDPADYGLILGDEAGRQTIGGVFAANLAGSKRLKNGAARDHLLGVQAVTGYGRIVKSGGRVMKNVTGYDLCKLMAGSYGTLAVLSHLTFKVLPRAESEATLLLAGDAAKLLHALRRSVGTAYDVSAAAYLPEAAAGRSTVQGVAGAARAAVRVEGAGPSVAYRRDRLKDLLVGDGLDAAAVADEDSRALWREIRDLRLLDSAAPVLWRLSVPPTRAGEMLEALGDAGETLFDWAGGLVWLAASGLEAAPPERVRGAVREDGHATLVKAPIEIRRTIEVMPPLSPGLLALNRRVKAGFDPKGVLNPGRLYGGV
ncbi:MAG: FAD-binding protein [Geminicoccaceae bacterium]|nr:FAD-binding protein [Geminicoccaceae bacterium]